MSPTRRELGRLAIAGLACAAVSATQRPRSATAATIAPNPTGSSSLKLGVSAPFRPSDDDLKFLQQTGIRYVYTAAPGLVSTDELMAQRERYANAGIVLHNVRWFSGAPSGGTTHLANILLNLEGRDESIEASTQWLRNYGAAGFDYNIATLSITGVWSSSNWSRRTAADGPALTRGGITREFNAADPDVRAGAHVPAGKAAGLDTVLYGRRYEEPEILENFAYFCRAIGPVAEQTGVRIGFHPDDPPTYKSLGGVARINGTFDQIKRNLALADSPNLGICFCAGVWLEGGEAMGMTLLEAIRYFLGTGKVWEFNFRNVSSTLPRFRETFMDNGYADLYPVMKVLVDNSFDGIVHQDHRVEMVGGSYAYDAYSNGYMKAMEQAARNELGMTYDSNHPPD